MPRGIPKDPNHPRNKKRQDASEPAAAPKRRGRPPGSGKKMEAAAPEKTKAATPSRKQLPGTPSGVTARVLSSDDAAHTVRSNIRVIAEAIQMAGTSTNLKNALEGQVQELLRLTSSTANETSDPDEEEEVPAPVASAPIPSAPALVTVPGNNLPTPPSFVPPPFPPPSAQ